MKNKVEFLHAPLKPHWTIGEGVNFGRGVRMGDYIVLESGNAEKGYVVLCDRCLIGNHATIRPPTIIGAETVLGHRVVIEGNVKIGYHCRLGNGSIFPRHVTIEELVFIGGGFVAGNDKRMKWMRPQIDCELEPILIRRAARIGVRCTVLPGVTIGENSFVGAGSLVTKNVPDRAVVMGHPAKFVGEVPDEECI